MSGALALARSGDRWSLVGKRVRVGRRERESAFDVGWRETPAGPGGLSKPRPMAHR